VDLIGKIEENIPRSWLSKQESTHKGSTGWGATHDSTIMLRKSLDFSYQGEAFQSLVTLINKVAQPKTAIVYPLAFNAGYICQLDKQIMIDDFDELLNKKLLGTVNGYGAFTRAEKPISVLERDLLLNY
jgi:hypothetical protein